MAVVGLDGCPTGWVAIRIDGDTREILFLREPADGSAALDALLKLEFDRAAIDMPIGLPERGYRDCDVKARHLLRPNVNRVFLGARRLLLTASSQAQANAVLKRRGEPGFSAQLWCLKKKLKEVDGFKARYRGVDLREAHPELVFLRLNRGEPLPAKKEYVGIDLRRKLLLDEGFKDIDTWLDRTRIGTGARPDDVLDACAVAIAARDFGQRHVVPAGEPERDAKGLPMQIWY